MAKKKSNAGPKAARAPRAKKTKPDVPGASGVAGIGDNSKHKLTADQERELFLSHRRAWNEWQNKVKSLEEIETKVKAALKNDGFTVKQFQIADSLGTPKGEARVQCEVKDRLLVARWMGHPMGAQMDLFEKPDLTPSVDKAFDAGKMDSMEGKPARPMYSPETEQYRSYMAGYGEHQATLVSKVGRGPDAGDKIARGSVTSGQPVSRSEFEGGANKLN